VSSVWKFQAVTAKRSPIRLRRIANKLRAKYLQKLGSRKLFELRNIGALKRPLKRLHNVRVLKVKPKPKNKTKTV
jgi:hypothetical protein